MRNATAVWHKNDDAVSPVIGTILMVAITVVLAAVLWLMVSGMIGGQEEQKITVNLGSPSTPEKFTRTTACWDTSMNINRITPKDQKVLWTELKILIKGSTGSLLLSAISPLVDTGVYANPLPSRSGSSRPAPTRRWTLATRSRSPV